MMNSPDRREGQPRSPLAIGFFGYEHSPWNLQVIPRAQQSVESFFVQNRGKHPTLVIENAFSSHVEARRMEQDVQNHGLHLVYANTIFINTQGRPPFPGDLQRYTRHIESNRQNVDLLLDQGVLSPQDIQRYFMFQMLDKVVHTHNIDIRYEGHSDEVLRTIIANQEQCLPYESQMSTAKKSGNLDLFMAASRGYGTLVADSTKIRDQSLVTMVHPLVEETQTTPKEHAVMLLGGKSHFLFPTMLADAQGAPQNPLITTNETNNIASPQAEVQILLRQNKIPEDIVFAQHGLEEQAINIVARTLAGRKQLSRFCYQYETLTDAIGNSVRRITSIDDARRLFANSYELNDHLAKNPVLKPVLAA